VSGGSSDRQRLMPATCPQVMLWLAHVAGRPHQRVAPFDDATIHARCSHTDQRQQTAAAVATASVPATSAAAAAAAAAAFYPQRSSGKRDPSAAAASGDYLGGTFPASPSFGSLEIEYPGGFALRIAHRSLVGLAQPHDPAAIVAVEVMCHGEDSKASSCSSITLQSACSNRQPGHGCIAAGRVAAMAAAGVSSCSLCECSRARTELQSSCLSIECRPDSSSLLYCACSKLQCTRRCSGSITPSATAM
jgi:hypothetical protein